MLSKIYQISLVDLSRETIWIILIISGLFTFAFYFLSNSENIKSRDKKSFLFNLYNSLFYIGLLFLLLSLFTVITGQKSIDFNSYGLMLAIAFLLGVYLISKKARREHIPEEPLLDLSLWGILVSMLGARMFYMIFEYEMFDPASKKLITAPYAFLNNPSSFLDISSGGLVVYGGFIFGITFSLIYIYKKKLPLGKIADIFAPSLALGVMFARLGCNFAGCCWGGITDSNNILGIPLSLFQKDSPVYDHYLRNFPQLNHDHLHIWPAQLISSANGLIMFIILSILYTKYHKSFPFQGLLFFIFLIYYAITRFLIEFIRTDTPKDFFSLTAAQFIGIMVILTSIGLIIYNYKKNRITS